MLILYNTLFMAVGLLLLWWSGELTVKYSVRAAHLLGISTLFVGFVVISITTGIPELGVAVMSLWYGAAPLSVGAVIGSNFSDVSLVLGIPALCFGSIKVIHKEYKELVFILFLSMAVMAVVFLLGTLQWWDGLILMTVYPLAFYKIWRLRHLPERGREYIKEEVAPTEQKHRYKSTRSIFWAVFKLFMSICVVVIASHLTVTGAVELAKVLPYSIETIGATIIAVGTSLPEMAIAFLATKRKEYSLAFGTSFGSVLEQGTLILGFIAFFSRMPVSVVPFRYIMPFMFGAFAVVGYGIIRREKVNRREGVFLVALYAVFIAYEAWFRI